MIHLKVSDMFFELPKDFDGSLADAFRLCADYIDEPTKALKVGDKKLRSNREVFAHFREIKKAIYDRTGPNMVIRCPHCNCWDKGLEGVEPGIYSCDECAEDFELEAEP